MLHFGSRFGKIQTESQNLITLIRTYSESKSYELVMEYITKLDKYITKDKNKLKIKDFPSSHKWFNSKPLSINKELKNKIVIIDFWTYWWINCLHVLPELEWLETKYSKENGVVFMGWHSAKFVNERESDKVLIYLRKLSIRNFKF